MGVFGACCICLVLLPWVLYVWEHNRLMPLHSFDIYAGHIYCITRYFYPNV